MPNCHRETIEESIQLRVWKITETEAELRQGLTLSPEALERLSQRRSAVHRKGYLAIRQLLKELEIAPHMHQYDSQGAPYLTDGRFLSISHTKDVAAVALSPTAVGVDLEHYQEKIIKIGPRFLHQNESADHQKATQMEYLTQIWTAKEALYKLYRKPGLHFNTQLCIAPFQKNDAVGSGTVLDEQQTHRYQLHYRYFEDFCLTLATP